MLTFVNDADILNQQTSSHQACLLSDCQVHLGKRENKDLKEILVQQVRPPLTMIAESQNPQ